jgi:hypothetical protein
VVEQGCLLSSYTGKTGVGGSNPPLSAISVWPVDGKATEPTVLWDIVLHAGAPQARVSRMDS